MKPVKKYSTGGTQESPRKAIERKIKELRSEISVANRSRYATDEQRQKDIKALQAQIRDFEAKLVKLG